MPRQNIVLTEFGGGLNYVADLQDVPKNVAVGGHNFEPVSLSGGRLRGILQNSEITYSDPNMGRARGTGYLNREDGYYDLIYWTKDNYLRVVLSADSSNRSSETLGFFT